jgi:hypothetical protein
VDQARSSSGDPAEANPAEITERQHPLEQLVALLHDDPEALAAMLPLMRLMAERAARRRGDARDASRKGGR